MNASYGFINKGAFLIEIKIVFISIISNSTRENNYFIGGNSPIDMIKMCFNNKRWFFYLS
jgi:hypothetical protein